MWDEQTPQAGLPSLAYVLRGNLSDNQIIALKPTGRGPRRQREHILMEADTPQEGRPPPPCGWKLGGRRCHKDEIHLPVGLVQSPLGETGLGMECVLSRFPVSQKPLHRHRGGVAENETKKSTKEKTLCLSLRTQRPLTKCQSKVGTGGLPRPHRWDRQAFRLGLTHLDEPFQNQSAGPVQKELLSVSGLAQHKFISGHHMWPCM